ncbi:MAG: amino acid ABC transporter substrate-binding protein [Spartobacteria bacterium]|nr:amino acid ABC transporter substrate-binding protein [Spartobacteria bacterium]
MNDIYRTVMTAVIFFSACTACIHAEAKDIQGIDVICPARESDKDDRDDDLVELLELALVATMDTDGPFTLCFAPPMNETRCRLELKAGRTLSVMWSTVTESMEKELLPIRIPLRRGIQGYRVFLIRAPDQSVFSDISKIDDLKKLRSGIDISWNDVSVLRNGGFNVVTGTNYDGLFGMLMRGRFDYFSRSIGEVTEEWNTWNPVYPEMAVEQTILLYYPWPKFFYVNKDNSQLADRIERGLTMLMNNGRYDQWFAKHNSANIDAMHIKDRRLFVIDNPLLPATVPLDRKDLWFNPFDTAEDDAALR